jgi:hypothetical protein
VNATGAIYSTVHWDKGQDSGLIQCMNGLPALIPIPVNRLRGALLKEGHNVSSASGSMAVSKVASAEGCHVEASSMGPAAALATALAEELPHWNTTFPDLVTDVMVCE